MSKGNTFIFVRHAETKKDPSKHSAEWELVPGAIEKLRLTLPDQKIDGTVAIYSSKESKAITTAAPIANRLNLETKTKAEFNEIARGSGFLSEQDFLREKEKQLTDWDYKPNDGESCNEGLERFLGAIEEIDNLFIKSKIVIVSHGTILSAYFTKLNGENNAFPRWSNMPFCAVGVIENGEIKEDIS